MWCSIPGFDGYQVNTDGRVRTTVDRRYLRAFDEVRQSQSTNGYIGAYLNGRRVSVHRLVCLAFHGLPPSDLHEVAHKNGDRTDNRPENLRWATRSENALERREHGVTGPRGEMQGRSVLKNQEVCAIRNLLKAGKLSQSEIAAAFGVARTTISSIGTNRNWRHIS